MTDARCRAPFLSSVAILTLLVVGGPSAAQSPDAAPKPEPVEPISFEDYDPPSTLVVPGTLVTRARYPFVDVHNHQWEMPTQDLGELVIAMDELNMAVMVNLSGRMRDGQGHLEGCLANVAANAPNRFLVFTNMDWEGIDEPEWGQRAAQQIRDDVAAGAAGLKIYKSLGMRVKDAAGARVAVDDPRIDPVWAVCGELGIPVLIHTGDPAPFWQPHDEQNERWLELKQKPNRKREAGVDPSWEDLMAEQRAVFARHPDTKFISAHLGWMGHDLGRLGQILDEHPNVSTEIGAVLAELGRQPRFAREFLTRYQDRVLFGKDAWTPDEYHVYFRVLETDDEYFDYYRRRHAFWKMYGLGLPDEVLRKLYFGNALELFPQLDRSLFPVQDAGSTLRSGRER
jgi:predicted TIM-barrel fold metal-dependent hydrolase